MRLIDADELAKNFAVPSNELFYAGTVLDYIKEAPTVEAVRHGRIMECTKNGKKERVFSCCGSKCTQLTMWVKPLYCIYCGAKMED